MDKKILFAIGMLAILLGIATSVIAEETRKVVIGKLNINEASAQDFSLLPGIGEKTGHRIVKYREEIGGFKTIEQIRSVKGIGNSAFYKIKDYLTLKDKSSLKVLIDINTATAPSLTLLPGISDKDAYAIIEYRKKNKGFKKAEELKLAGVSKEKFDEIRDLITVLEFKAVKGK